MRYLVTGITGFIGSHLKEALDGEIYGLVQWFHKKQPFEGFIPIFGDLRNYHDLVNIIKDIKPEIIIHLGGITPVSLSFDRPFEYFETNVTGAINLVEINRKFNPYLKKLIVASTPEVYGIQDQLPISEKAEMNPNSPYAVSKAAADLYFKFGYKSYKLPIIFSRHANCYGRKDQMHFVIESIVTQMLTKKEIYLGNPNPKRDFLYIDDVVNFYLQLIEKGKFGEIYNGGWSKAYSIKEIVEMAKEITDFKGKIHWNSLPSRPGEIPEISLDSMKAMTQLGWKPTIDIKEGLKLVADYWRDKL